MTTRPHFLVVADTGEGANWLLHEVLPRAGVTAEPDDPLRATLADALIVDVTRLRADPLAGLKTQRVLGSDAPALLCAPRITEEMADDVFELGVRKFVRKPVDSDQFVELLAVFAAEVQQERSLSALREQLAEAERALARRLEEISAVARVGRSIASLTDADAIARRTIEAATFLTGADTLAFFLPQAAYGGLTPAIEQGHGADLAKLNQPPIRPIIERVQQSGQAGKWHDPAQDPNASPAGVALPAGGGVFVAACSAGAGLGEADEVILGMLADFTAVALAQVWAREDARQQVDAALQSAREVALHAGTLLDPIEGIEGQAEALLQGGVGPLAEAQLNTVQRIRHAAGRLKEIAGYIEAALAEGEDGAS